MGRNPKLANVVRQRLEDEIKINFPDFVVPPVAWRVSLKTGLCLLQKELGAVLETGDPIHLPLFFWETLIRVLFGGWILQDWRPLFAHQGCAESEESEDSVPHKRTILLPKFFVKNLIKNTKSLPLLAKGGIEK
jgi:hypothetical protein